MLDAFHERSCVDSSVGSKPINVGVSESTPHALSDASAAVLRTSVFVGSTLIDNICLQLLSDIVCARLSLLAPRAWNFLTQHLALRVLTQLLMSPLYLSPPFPGLLLMSLFQFS